MHGFDDIPGRAFGPLTQSECLRLLETHSLGRLAWQSAASQQVRPINYVFRSGAADLDMAETFAGQATIALELALPAQERKHDADDIGRSEPLDAHGARNAGDGRSPHRRARRPGRPHRRTDRPPDHLLVSAGEYRRPLRSSWPIPTAIDNPRRSGLANLRNRAASRGGTLTLENQEQGGLRLRWSIPLST